LRDKFYDTYGGETTFSMLTASPVLESLNSGMQLYRVKQQQPGLFSNIGFALHLPQYFSFLLTGQPCSDITSIGCHTNLWDFQQDHYHEWVYREGVIDKLAPILPSTAVLPVKGAAIPLSGIGLHDSSAALIPYQESFREPFVLISTGTWCISMNPFNDAPLTVAELQKDCLCYMSYQGHPIKASRLFAGHEHEQQVQRLAAQFQVSPALAATVAFDADCIALLRARDRAGRAEGLGAFQHRELSAFPSFEVAYHQLMLDIMDQQVDSTRLVLHGTDTHRIFVDGGFGRNQVYMHLLARAFPDTEVFTASIPQATAMGAALAIHQHWNNAPLPGDIIELKYYG
jgi:L-fuculokinase